MSKRDWFREAFDNHAGGLLSYARSLLRDIDDLRPYAEDYVQMAFLQLFLLSLLVSIDIQLIKGN